MNILKTMWLVLWYISVTGLLPVLIIIYLFEYLTIYRKDNTFEDIVLDGIKQCYLLNAG